MRFTKMEGLGNDYIYLNCLSRRPPDPAGLAVRLSDRHFGVGADGLICVCPGRRGDFAMEMYNADGSRGKMCGNGIRCLGKYVYDKGLTRRTSLQVDTDSGLRALRLLPGPAGIGQVEVDMGEPSVFPQISIPLMELTYSVMPVSMGNPHCILFCPHPEEIALDVLGPALERHPVFPDRTNVEFVAVEGDQLRLRVWSGAAARLWPAAPAPAPPWLPPTSWDCAPQRSPPFSPEAPWSCLWTQPAGTSA